MRLIFIARVANIARVASYQYDTGGEGCKKWDVTTSAT